MIPDDLVHLKKHTSDPKFGQDFQAIYRLFSTPEGQKNCRNLLKKLSATLATGKTLDAVLKDSEKTIMEFQTWEEVFFTLHPPVFQKKLRDRVIMIDYGVGWHHGLHTHRVQWWLVCKAREEKLITLTNAPGKIYEELGDKKYLAGNRSLWDDLFDRPYSITGKPFGSPEWLHQHVLAKQKDEYMALVEQLTAENKRYEKEHPKLYLMGAFMT